MHVAQVLEAQNVPAAPATPVEPCAKKRRTVEAEAPASPVKSKAKRRPAASAYSLWSLEHRAAVVGGSEKVSEPFERRRICRRSGSRCFFSYLYRHCHIKLKEKGISYITVYYPRLNHDTSVKEDLEGALSEAHVRGDQQSGAAALEGAGPGGEGAL